jgi:hypothetical protein
MKNLMILGTLFALSSAAYADPFTCTTNVQHDVRQVSTTFTFDTNAQLKTYVTMQTNGGMRHFVTAPRTIFVTAQSHGPEMTQYFNSKEDFELTVVSVPRTGQIYGTFVGEIMGRRVQTPVVCVAAQPVIF